VSTKTGDPGAAPGYYGSKPHILLLY